MTVSLWRPLREALLGVLTGKISLADSVEMHGVDVSAAMLRWGVRAEATHSLKLAWFAQALLSSNFDMRGAACDVLAECDVSFVADTVRHLKEVHHKLPRSTRTQIIKGLRALESEPELEFFAQLNFDALRYLYATLHIRPSSRMQSLLFERQRPSTPSAVRSVLPWEADLGGVEKERLLVQLYVDSSRFVSPRMVEEVEIWLSDMAQRALFTCELYRITHRLVRCHPVEQSPRGWKDALSTWPLVGEPMRSNQLMSQMLHGLGDARLPVRHVIHVRDASLCDEASARTWCEQLQEASTSSTRTDVACLVSVVRWGASRETRGVEFVGERGCVLACGEELDRLANTMAYVLF